MLKVDSRTSTFSSPTKTLANALCNTKAIVLGKEHMKYNSFLHKLQNVKQVMIDFDVMMILTEESKLQVFDTKYELKSWVNNYHDVVFKRIFNNGIAMTEEIE